MSFLVSIWCNLDEFWPEGFSKRDFLEEILQEGKSKTYQQVNLSPGHWTGSRENVITHWLKHSSATVRAHSPRLIFAHVFASEMCRLIWLSGSWRVGWEEDAGTRQAMQAGARKVSYPPAPPLTNVKKLCQKTVGIWVGWTNMGLSGGNQEFTYFSDRSIVILSCLVTRHIINHPGFVQLSQWTNKRSHKIANQS